MPVTRPKRAERKTRLMRVTIADYHAINRSRMLQSGTFAGRIAELVDLLRRLESWQARQAAIDQS